MNDFRTLIEAGTVHDYFQNQFIIVDTDFNDALRTSSSRHSLVPQERSGQFLKRSTCIVIDGGQGYSLI